MENGLVKIDFTQDQVHLIKSQICPKATDDELKLFLYQAKRTGLDPLARQIYAIHRWNSAQGKEVMTIQTSIDGFRVIAERSGDYGGQDEPIFEPEVGNLLRCTVTVYRFRGDVRYPAAVGVAYWDEYVQTDKQGNPSGLWKKMPHVMLSKVAEAVALRKAYPQDLSGLYTYEEMNQADKPTVEETDETPTRLEKDLLKSLVWTANIDEDKKTDAMQAIENCNDYKTFEKLKYRLEDLQPSIDEIPNPLQRDINTHLKKIK